MNPSPAAIPKAVWIAATAFASVILILLAAVLYKLNRPSPPAPTPRAGDKGRRATYLTQLTGRPAVAALPVSWQVSARRPVRLVKAAAAGS